MREAIVVGLIGTVLVVFGATTAFAQRFESDNYTIDGNIGGSLGGVSESANYQLVSSGGNSVIGNGAGGSYVLDEGYVAQLADDEEYLELALSSSGLVSHYRFNETSGLIAQDSSPSAKNASVNYEQGPRWTSGRLDNAMSLDMLQDEYAEVTDTSHLPSGSKMTVMMWYKQNELSRNRSLAARWDYSTRDGSWALQTEPGGDGSRLYFIVADTTDDTGDNYVKTGAGLIDPGIYQHVVVVYDGSLPNSERVKIYVDGIQVSTQTTGTITADLADTDSPMRIGDFKGLNRYFNGDIDNLKIFDRALSDTEVHHEYTNQSDGIEGSGVEFGGVVPGAPKSVPLLALVGTNASAYGLSIDSPDGLRSGSDQIPSLAASVTSPIGWSDGETTGLAMSVEDAPAFDPKWQSGNRYSGIPVISTMVYSQNLATSVGEEVIRLKFRLDVEKDQPTSDYSGILNFTATALP